MNSPSIGFIAPGNASSELILRTSRSTETMTMCSLLFCGLAAVLATGCNYKIASAPESNATIPALTDSTGGAVPLPAQTQYDGQPKAKAVYLEYYAMGYRLAATDNAAGGCLCGTESGAEFYEATLSGFLAGKEAGSAAFAKKKQQNQTPTTDASGTPAATLPPRQR